jgi:uncharacterized membrane protein
VNWTLPEWTGHGAVQSRRKKASQMFVYGPSSLILAERFARGEIDEDAFWQRMTALRARRPDDHSAAAR